MISDTAALKKWRTLDTTIQTRLLENVFCNDCFVTTIVDYSITSDESGILLTGKCMQCGKDVARLVENDWFRHESKQK